MMITVAADRISDKSRYRLIGLYGVRIQSSFPYAELRVG
jgi:hypothetical protein